MNFIFPIYPLLYTDIQTNSIKSKSNNDAFFSRILVDDEQEF
jgi:hypothetical protein